MKAGADRYKREISRTIWAYIIGCCCFVLAALASIWLGYYVIRYHDEHGLPASLVILSFAGCLLLWEMAKAFHIKPLPPDGLRPINAADYPELFAIIDEVTGRLHLTPIDMVYISNDAVAAVFIQPLLRNLLFKPRRSLVFGLGFLTQMGDDEIRAVLYHEFGHYAQTEMKKTLSVYAIGQFSKSFVAIRETKKENTFQQQLKIQVLLFTFYTLSFCGRINRAYSRLARQMEYDADDVAVRFVGAETLQRSLLHAACIRYNYEVLQWGVRQLQSQDIQVDNQYLALSFISSYSHPSRSLLSEEVVRRVERLGELKCSTASAPDTVRRAAFSMAENGSSGKQLCTASQFAQWMQQGFAVYTRQRLLANSVSLESHLDRKKHRLPLLDAPYTILLDGREIGTGNFIKGYTLRFKTSPGKHIITTYAPSGIISTPFEFVLESDRSYRIEMDYKVYLKDGVYDVFGASISEK